MTSEVGKPFLRKKVFSLLADSRTVDDYSFDFGYLLNHAVQLIKVRFLVANKTFINVFARL